MLAEKDIYSVKDIIRKAGQAVLQEYASLEQSITIKDDFSPLTKADLRSNAIIEEGLNSLDLKLPIVSEENKRMDSADRRKLTTFWLVDPLDGTKEFVNKNGEFAICIALIHEGRSIAGFIYAPVTDDLYYAIENKGAIKETENTIIDLKIPKLSSTDKNLRIAVSRSHRSPEEDLYINQLLEPVLITKGSILKMTEIACGNIDIYPRFDEKTKEWDIAAGQIIIEEAGGEVVHRLTNKPIRYNKASLQNPPFIARAKIL